MENFKRVWFDVVLGVLFTGLFLSGFYENFSPPIQLISLKLVLVSMGFLHSHILGKLCFPRVDWEADFVPAHFARILLYVTVIYAYSQGG